MLSWIGRGAGRRRPIVAFVGALGLIVTLGTGYAEAGPISPGTWYEFGFTAIGVDATACFSCIPSSGTPTTDADSPPWTFTSPAGGSTMVVTDAFLSGDSFQIFNFGAPLFSTPLVGPGSDCGNDPVPCFFDPAMSSAVFFLAPGNYSFTIQPTASVVGSGAAYFGISTDQAPLPGTAVPEPATLILLGSGLAAAGVRRMRKRA